MPAASRERLEPYTGAPLPDTEVSEGDLYLLLFTSGTTGAPKAVLCSQGRLAGIGRPGAEFTGSANGSVWNFVGDL